MLTALFTLALLGDQAAKSHMKTRIASAAGLLIGLAGIAFVVKTLVTKWDDVSQAFGDIDPINLLGSLALGLCAMTLIGTLWVSMLHARGHVVSRRQALSWYFTGQLGKYVPGGIWPIVGRAELAVRHDIPRSDAYASTGLSLVTTYLGAIIAIALGAIASRDHLPIAALIIVSLFVGYAVFSNDTLRTRVLSIAGRISPNLQSLTEPRRLATLAIAHVPAWILMSLSTSVTANAFGAKISITDMLFVTSASWLAGFVVVGVPGGIGVREAAFTSLASGMIGAPMAVSLALMSRVVFITVDLLGAAVSNVVARSAVHSPNENL